MIIGLIPSRLNSKRLKNKSLLEIDGLPMIVHTFKRAMLAKKLDKVIVCTDSKKTKSVVENHGGNAILTSKKHNNGTERIAEVSKKFNCKLVIKFHLKNKHFDIVLPSVQLKRDLNSRNVVKVVKSKSNKVLYFSRSNIPYEFSSKNQYFLKHYSIISFKPKKLFEFSKLNKGELEKVEGVELLRALENDFSIGTYIIKNKSFAIDVKEDLIKALQIMPSDKIRKLY